MRGDEARGPRLLLAEFGILMEVAPPRDQLDFDLRSALTDFLFEVGDSRLRPHRQRPGNGQQRKCQCE